MGSPATAQVPKVLSLSLEDAKIELEKVGLLMGSVTEVYNDTIPKGKVTKTSPDAGAIVNSGSTIGVQVSSGTQTAQGAAVPGVSPPAAQVAGVLRAATAPAVSGLAVPSPSQVGVPHLIGLTQTAAAGVLKSAGLTVGAITTSPSSLIPANGVSATDPADGTLVNQGSAVDLEISTGPKRDWSQYIPTALFTLLGLIVLGLIVYGVTQSSGSFLASLAQKDTARGLITFLITVATVGIALILAISTIVTSEGEGGDKRFDRGKQVLSVLIGVLGTIVGFYFGSSEQPRNSQPQANVVGQAGPLKITTVSLLDAVVGKDYSVTLTCTGQSGHLKWSVNPELPADFHFDEANGRITGKPSATLKSTPYTFTVTDDASPPNTSPPTKLTLQVNAAGASQ